MTKQSRRGAGGASDFPRNSQRVKKRQLTSLPHWLAALWAASQSATHRHRSQRLWLGPPPLLCRCGGCCDPTSHRPRTRTVIDDYSTPSDCGRLGSRTGTTNYFTVDACGRRLRSTLSADASYLPAQPARAPGLGAQKDSNRVPLAYRWLLVDGLGGKS